jgi:hypothetical protein
VNPPAFPGRSARRRSLLAMTRRTRARLAIIAVMATGALVGLGTAAKADPRPDWKRGSAGIQYEFGDVAWGSR